MWRAISFPSDRTIASIVFGCGSERGVSSKTISARSPNTLFKTRSVPCPLPVSASDPYRQIRKRASGYSSLSAFAAFSGPMA